jgi:hypothetical protein
MSKVRLQSRYKPVSRRPVLPPYASNDSSCVISVSNSNCSGLAFDPCTTDVDIVISGHIVLTRKDAYGDVIAAVGIVQKGTLPSDWTLVGAADFNRDGHPDYLLFSPTTRAKAIWYMSNNIRVGGARGPTLPVGWELVGH